MCLPNNPIILDLIILQWDMSEYYLCNAAAGVSFLWCIILSTMQGKYDAEGAKPEGKKLENEQGEKAPA